MPTFYFRKLVRDKVLQRCIDDPKVRTNYHTLTDAEYKAELLAKIHEEAEEIPLLDEANDEVLSEIADVQAVIDSLIKGYGLTKEQIAEAQSQKEVKNGAFDDRAYIESVELDDDSEWVAILREQPEKYEEAA